VAQVVERLRSKHEALSLNSSPEKKKKNYFDANMRKSRKSREHTGISRGNDFLNRTQMAQQLRERMDKWDKKLKSLCTTTTKKWFLN
jgi:hypothetical protein